MHITYILSNLSCCTCLPHWLCGVSTHSFGQIATCCLRYKRLTGCAYQQPQRIGGRCISEPQLITLTPHASVCGVEYSPCVLLYNTCVLLLFVSDLQVTDMLLVLNVTDSLVQAAAYLTPNATNLTWPSQAEACGTDGSSHDDSFADDSGLGRDDVTIDYDQTLFSYVGCRCSEGFDNVYTFDDMGRMQFACVRDLDCEALSSCHMLHTVDLVPEASAPDFEELQAASTYPVVISQLCTLLQEECNTLYLAPVAAAEQLCTLSHTHFAAWRLVLQLYMTYPFHEVSHHFTIIKIDQLISPGEPSHGRPHRLSWKRAVVLERSTSGQMMTCNGCRSCDNAVHPYPEQEEACHHTRGDYGAMFCVCCSCNAASTAMAADSG